MAGKTKVFAKSIARQWSNLVQRDPDGVVVLSPYLTSRTAESVVQSADRNSCKIYTLFCVEVFAVGASSLATIKKLISEGFQVHHVDDLHAKVVLTNSALSVGSQNLTAKGIRELNDQFRTTLSGGTVVMTRGVQALPSDVVTEILKAVVTFTDFTPDNDPHEEHDFGALTIEGQKIFFKLDYYDLRQE